MASKPLTPEQLIDIRIGSQRNPLELTFDDFVYVLGLYSTSTELRSKSENESQQLYETIWKRCIDAGIESPRMDWRQLSELRISSDEELQPYLQSSFFYQVAQKHNVTHRLSSIIDNLINSEKQPEIKILIRKTYEQLLFLNTNLFE